MNNRHGKIPELTCPAGDPEKLRAAVRYGADAVYLAGKGFGMRAASGNFTPDEMSEAIKFAHEHGVLVYVTVNTMPRWNEYDELGRYLSLLGDIRPDAIIVADLGVLELAKEAAPSLEIHVSTQAGAVSHADCSAWHRLGAKRVVLAREMTLDDIAQIRRRISPELELETFVHGAMCVAWSGRCLLSANLSARDGNRGACSQPCRWNYEFYESTISQNGNPDIYYEIDEEKRRGRRLPVIENNRGTFILSSRDMNMIEHIPELCACGTNALKIEGRVKSACYAAVTASCYRRALDKFASEGENYTLPPQLPEMLDSISHRVYGTGFYFSRPEDAPDAQLCAEGETGYVRERPYLATVTAYDRESGRATLRQRCKFAEGDRVSLLLPGKDFINFTASGILDAEGQPIESTPHPGMEFSLPVPTEVEPGDMLILGA